MKGRFYMVGVGPGAPDLLTLRALRILESAPVICVPKGKSDGSSVALSIIGDVVSLENKEVVELYFPMEKIRRGERQSENLENAWQEAASAVTHRLDRNLDVAFPTLGDPSFYSTAFHLATVLRTRTPAFSVHVVPGVSSINAASAATGHPMVLGDERMAVLPATYESDKLTQALRDFDTIVLMKVNKALDRMLDMLENISLLDRAVIIEKASMNEERITPAAQARGMHLHYFSIMIVRKN